MCLLLWFENKALMTLFLYKCFVGMPQERGKYMFKFKFSKKGKH